MNMWLEWALTSSALILAVTLLRRALGGRVGAGLRYAVWAFVLLRLLVPAQIITVTVPTREAGEREVIVDREPDDGVDAPSHGADAVSGTIGQGGVSGNTAPAGAPGQSGLSGASGHAFAPGTGAAVDVTPGVAGGVSGISPQVTPGQGDVSKSTQGSGDTGSDGPAKGVAVSLGTALTLLWLGGAIAAALALMLVNLRLECELRRRRTPLAGTGCRIPVYILDGPPAPCLFGLFRPAVYVDAAAASDPAMLRHILAHEETHYRHGDHVWSFLRCAALAIHWWNPLVWLAAALSRRDGELFCDEGALKRLGGGERAAYGETLLAVVTAKPAPSHLLSCATTMSGGKKALRERVERIAKPVKRRAWAVALALAVALAAAACSFANPVEKPEGEPDRQEPSGDDTPGVTAPGPEANGTENPGPAEAVVYGVEYPDPDAVPLTADELRFFNEHFFNGSEGINYSILNQFANPLNLYSGPEENDLYELFYCDEGAGGLTDEELEAMGGESVKLTEEHMDYILLRYTGIGLDATQKKGLDKFTYLEKSDAYFRRRVDTNYPGTLTFLAGTRSGDTVRLYQRSDYVYGWYCVTLKKTDEPDRGYDGYIFVSNRACGHPAVPTVYPDLEPERVIALSSLEPYAPPEVKSSGSFEGEVIKSVEVAGHTVALLKNADGELAAAVLEGDRWRVFETGLENSFNTGLQDGAGIEPFRDVLGRDGVRVAHWGYVERYSINTVYDYFSISEAGEPEMMLRIGKWYGRDAEPRLADLDGDGTDELANNDSIFFLRDGVIYRADIAELLDDGEVEWWRDYFGNWDMLDRSMSAVGWSRGDSPETPGKRYVRTVCFDGENLRVYKEDKPWHDHVVDGVGEGIPAEVMDAARAYVENEVIREKPDGTYSTPASGDGAVYDDWRIERISFDWSKPRDGGRTVEIYYFNYELHTLTPENVGMAGGKYMTEDDWVSPGYPNCDMLVFINDGGSRTLLWHEMNNDMSLDSEWFQNYLDNSLRELGL